jgi:hypothetical protein
MTAKATSDTSAVGRSHVMRCWKLDWAEGKEDELNAVTDDNIYWDSRSIGRAGLYSGPPSPIVKNDQRILDVGEAYSGSYGIPDVVCRPPPQTGRSWSH